jgi:hypothetical protein
MLRACLKLGVMMFALCASVLHAEPAYVARAALSAGEAKLMRAAGGAEPLRLGAQLAAGDRIITGKDAIAVLVFSDGGRVSLRGDSELVIHHYDIDASGANTRLELELVRGAMRQISGEAARLQPERYRLNTPVVAIGVRGTDFLARTDGSMMETFVQEGMIVVLPRGGGCADVRASSNCRPMASVSASDAGRYLRVSASGQMERPLVSAEDLERLFGIRIGTDRGSSATPAPGLVFVAGVGADVAGSLNSRGMTHEAGLLETRSTAFAPDTPVAAPQKLPEQLVWGRFSSAASLPMQLPVPYSQAAAGSHVTVGEIGQYALWRTGANGPLDRTLAGKVDFNLAAAEAVFQQASGLSRAEVQAARLGIDFDRSTFSAGVTLSHAATGQVAFGVDGRMSNEGVFWAGNAAERIAGAVSRDGSEAGFLFTKEHPAGTFRGVTLWNGR